MKKNSINVFSSIFFLFILLLGAVNAGSAVRITLLNQNPNPASPGKYVDLNFQIENVGDSDAENVIVELVSEYPFSLDPNENSEKILGKISSGRQGDDAALAKYKVRIDEKAVEGNNKVKIRYKKNNADKWTYQEFNVNIESLSYALSISEVRTTPEELKPGEKGKLEVTLENTGYNSIKDISLRLILASYDSSGLSDLAPLSTLHSSTEKRKNYIDAGEKETFSYEIIANPDANPDIYKLPVIMSYYDSNNEKVENTDFIGVIIGDKPNLVTQVQESGITTAGQKGKITLSIINKGITDAKFVDVKLDEIKDATLLSTTDEFYIGGVDSDDYENFDVELYVKPNAKENIVLPLTIVYKDPNNKEYQDKVDIKIDLYTKEEAEKMGLVKTKSNTGYIIAGVIVILGFLFFRARKKRKKQLKKK